MRVRIKDIKEYEDIYPRSSPNEKLIEKYVANMEAGDIFPAIEIQKVSDAGKEFYVVLDGWHRIEAYKQRKETEIEAKEWQQTVLVLEDNLVALLARSGELNSEHGLRLNPKGVRARIRAVAHRVDEWKHGYNNKLAEAFKKSPKTISEYVKDIRAQKNASRDSQILKLSYEGFLSQRQIGKQFDLDHSVITRVVQKSELPEFCTKLNKQGKDPADIALSLNADIPTIYHILLRDKSDDERFEEFVGEKPKDFDVWGFSKRDDRLGVNAPGKIPGQIAMNILYRFTEQGDLIVDPMSGGGSTADACLIMDRKFAGFDRNPNKARKDIVKYDLNDGLDKALKGKKAKLIFYDPPYYNKVDTISGFKDVDEFNEFMSLLAQTAKDNLDGGGYAVLVMSNYLDYENPEKSIFVYRYATEFEFNGFKTVAHISCPLSTEQYKGRDVKRAREKGIMLQRSRDIYVFKKM